MTITEARRLAVEYRKLLRKAKRLKLDLGEAPPGVQEALLALHQNALLVFKYDRDRQKESKHAR